MHDLYFQSKLKKVVTLTNLGSSASILNRKIKWINFIWVIDVFTPLVLVIIRLVALNSRYLFLEIIGTFILWDFLTYRVTCARKDGCHAHWRRWEVGSLRGLHGKCALNSVRGRDETRPFCFSSNNSSVWVYFLKTPKRPCKTLHRCSASHTPIPSRVCVCVFS